MPRPEVSELTESFYSALGWWTSEDEENDWTALKVAAAWVETLFDPVYTVVAEGDDLPGWAILLDPWNCPAKGLPFLAQWVGAILTPGMNEAQRRAEIAEPTSWKRGRLTSLKLVGARELTGEEKRVIVRPRTPVVGAHYVRTLLAETPSPARTKANVREALAAWEALDFAAIDGVSLADIEAGWELLEDLEGDFSTLAEIEELLPIDLPE